MSGRRVLAASCVRPAENNMVVSTNSEKVTRARRTLIELLMADHPSPCARQRQSNDCELETLARLEGIKEPRFPRRLSPRGQDNSSLVIAVDHEACILCDRCIRGCDEIRHNDVLGRRGKGFMAGIAFDYNLPMGNSSCVSCGECMVSCPTGALTNKSVVKTVLPGEPVPSRGTAAINVLPESIGNFSGTEQQRGGPPVFQTRRHRVPRRRVRVDRFLHSRRPSPGFSRNADGAFQKRFGRHRLLWQAHQPFAGPPTRAAPGRRRAGVSIPIDAPVDLPYDHPVATLGPGDLFGEMTCMSLYPRSATVRAATDCVMFEMLRNVLDIIQRNKTLKAQLDANYRKRALDDHLRSVPMFASLTQDFIDVLRNKVELVRYTKGDIICRQGDIADNFYLIRLGFVKVSEPHPGGELVLAYLGRGGYFGEIGLLGEGRRTATCTALDHVELVRIHADEFHQMVAQFPEVRQRLEAMAAERQEQNRQRLSTATSMPLDSFLDAGSDGGTELARPGSRTLHPLRRLRSSLRGRARWSHTFDPRGPAIRQIPWSPHPAAIAAIRCAWSVVRWAPYDAAIRSKSSSRTGVSVAGFAQRTARTATSICIHSR